MDILKTVTIEKPIADVWKLLSEDFGKVSEWTLAVVESEALTDGEVKGANGMTGRKISTPEGVTLIENYVEYSEENHSYTYTVTGLPSFITSATNSWTLESLSDTETKLTARILGTVNTFPGMLLYPLLQYILMPKLQHMSTKDAKEFLEAGHPSDAKVKQMAAKT
mmetsp:Transcript_19747/g.49130  ORF Transcript_19747/g.49130 Transcript_19747/m.49130 type:complete len:166 (-) Transcript_19747:77-574(-)|eukprot:CAMPEP_0174898284 /NCGR_PEP_ID=MMETSP0167-20121228/20600_1 /TAXON_ID=38298 /ORGANISM="Rhodella maculata, Strain CCMP736" /LENGTH=165 /DNA_ID=CAMNT_0016138801 /DNA_START=51 /DNA_END=548 /DNA_ORIENTATION=-